jgi:hypothetical protein
LYGSTNEIYGTDAVKRGLVTWLSRLRRRDEILTDDQYYHVVGCFDQLAAYENPMATNFLDICSLGGGLLELRDKHGLFGKLNVRTYFAMLIDRRIIVVLGCRKKEQEGQTAKHVMLGMKNRLRCVTEIVSMAKEQGRCRKRESEDCVLIAEDKARQNDQAPAELRPEHMIVACLLHVCNRCPKRRW